MKRSFKKFLAIAIVATVLIATLVGCASSNKKDGPKKNPTAKDLMNNPFCDEKVESASMDMIFAIDMSSIVAEDEDSLSVNTNISMDLTIEYDKDTTYTYGTATVEFLGFEMEVETKSYCQIKDDTYHYYTYDSSYECWEHSTSDMNETTEFDGYGFHKLTHVDAEKLADLKLETDGDTYVVTGQISAEDMCKAMDTTPEDFFGSMSGVEDGNYDDVCCNITAIFDKDTQVLKSIKYEIDAETATNDEFVINAYSIELVVNKLNNVKVEVPQEVLDEVDEYDNIGGSYDDSYDDDYDSDYEDDFEVEEDEFSAESSFTDSSDWRSLKFTFDGYDMQLKKTTLQEFLNNSNYELDETENPAINMVNPDDSDRLYFIHKTNKDTYDWITVEVYNPNDKPIAITECVIIGFSYDSWDLAMGYKAASSMSVGGVSIGDKNIDFETYFGEVIF